MVCGFSTRSAEKPHTIEKSGTAPPKAQLRNIKTALIRRINAMTKKVHYTELLPYDFRAQLARCAVGYLPLGTLEWHGEHCALGADALIATGLFTRAAQALGGIVFPPLFLGPDRARRQPDDRLLVGMDYAETTTPARQLDGSCYWAPEGLFLLLCENIIAQAQRAGFRALVADGHGPSRWAWGRHVGVWEAQYGIQLVSVDRDLPGWRSQIDHAAKNETSLMLALRPDLVDLARLPADAATWPQGVGGEDPRAATAAHGEECIEICLALLGAHLAALGVLASS
jgi:creatinine amidohydrolase